MGANIRTKAKSSPKNNVGVDSLGIWLPGYIDDTMPTNYKNFVIRQNQFGTRISGSIPKLLRGSNFDPANASDCKNAIQNLENELALDLSSANVVRLDIATTVAVNEQPKNYFKLLGQHQYLLERLIQPNGIRYRNDTLKQSKQLCVYDKQHEARAKGGDVPDNWIDKHALRLELQLYRIKRFFGRHLCVQDLYHSVVHDEMCVLLQREVSRVRKLPDEMPHVTGSDLTASTAQKLILGLLFQRDNVYATELLRTIKPHFTTDKEYYRLRRQINSRPIYGKGHHWDKYSPFHISCCQH